MKTKKCYKCGEVKILSEFYSRKDSPDGYRNDCKECCKKKTIETRLKNEQNPKWVWKEKERKRREALKRVAEGKQNQTLEQKRRYKKNWKHGGVKIKAAASANLDKTIVCPKGYHKHHWSYNEDHWRDVIILSIKDHHRVHRYTVYDPDRLMYRTIYGVLLDSRERAEEYYKYIFTLKDGEYPQQ